MRKTDRLSELMTILRDGQVHKADDLALATGVSLRTIYRDMEVLVASGVPVQGARGTGYQAQALITLPALHLTEDELEALHLSLAILGESGMEGLADAAASLSAKIEQVLPEDSDSAGEGFGFAAYPFDGAARGVRHMPGLKAAIKARQKLRLRLQTGGAEVIRPLQVDYWGRVWRAIVWSETQAGFAEIRLDQIAEMTVLPGLFVDEPGKSLSDYRAS
ncbi:hypothetical protein PRI8871_02328 [Pseudoprimorskyibacter insulae]|uniref:Helix-turn-helix type 11 domain-containing protein n=2 Tax=Pseudoprimorskyibacter insulae TaxID=1695997 RepID=A0A2R8AWY9_9RHOB|nr:hypothetical protein PRI8871_02328 [Pseudoprimorskyibacter insulae]